MASSPVAVGEVFAGKYRVEGVLGEGGMGVVVRAHHLELDQPVAVKFLLGDVKSMPEGEERFRREARAAAKIQSDHVVRVLDVGLLEDGTRFMVMEFLAGGDLAEELEKRGSLPVGEAVTYLLEALDAVGHAHQAGIVHRDLKPANLFLVQRADGSKRVKVLDFGISKTIGTSTTEQLSLTRTSAWIGSPLYMAPEQMQSARDVDARADIWSLGAILYEMLSGSPPYLADSLPQLCNLLLTTDARDIRDVVPGLPDELTAAVMGCLARDPQKRIASAGELMAALAPHASNPSARRSFAGLARTELQGASTTGGSGFRLSGSAPSDSGSRPGAKTAAAWGAQDASAAGLSAASSRTGLWFGGAAALLLVGAGVWFALGPGGGAPPEVAPELASGAPMVTPAAAPLESMQVQAVEEVPPPMPAASGSAVSGGSAVPGGSAVSNSGAAPSGSAEPVAGAAKPATKPPTTKPTTSTKPATTKPSGAASGDDFSEFGGRR